MNAAFLALLLSSVLTLAAFGGPWLLRQAVPVLSSAPCLAAFAFTITALLWVAAVVAIGPIVAWMSRGSAWLPEQIAGICGRCMSVANPFGESAMSVGIPAVVPLALPIVGALVVLVGLMRELRLINDSQVALARAIHAISKPMTLLGYRVRVTAEKQAHAFSLPNQFGGIVLLQGALVRLSSAELSAVLAHEQAHLTQRHHLGLALLIGATRYLCWVPFIRAVREAVPLYLEIAADQVAKDAPGITVLASALLKLGQPSTPESNQSVVSHAALRRLALIASDTLSGNDASLRARRLWPLPECMHSYFWL